MSRILGLVTLAVVTSGAPAALAAQVEVAVEGYAQFQFNTTSVDAADAGKDEIAASTFETRRIRPTVSVTIDEWITGEIQPDFALGRIALKDAFINFAIDDAFELQVGQYKKPFSRLDLVSSSKILPIERGVRIRDLEDALVRDAGAPAGRLDIDGDLLPGEEQELLDLLGYKGRDMGLMAHGAVGLVEYAVGVFNGDGADRRDANDGKSVAGRLELTPWTGVPLSLGGAASYRETRLGGAELSGTAFEASAEWGDFRRPGLHLIAEAVLGDNLVEADGTVFGAQGWLAYFHPLPGARLEGVEPVVRTSFGNPSTDLADDEGWLFTPGLNLYFHGRNRVMLNWDVFLPAGTAETQSALRAQAQLHF